MSFDASKINPECAGCQELLSELRASRQRVQRLERELRKRDEQAAQQQQLVQDLEQRIEGLEREAHRQAAPFRRPPEKRTRDPRPPSRKKGHPGSYRKPPPQVDTEIRVPLKQCPQCGERVEKVRSREQIIEELELRVRRFRLITQVGHCAACGSVHSTHPLQVSTATGAAGTHLGAHALGFAAFLNKQLGLPMAKTCAVLKQCGLSLTVGGPQSGAGSYGRSTRRAS